MKSLLALSDALGWKSGQTHLNSGNLLFSAPRSPELLAVQLEQAILAHAGFGPSVIIKSRAEMEAVIADAPFVEARGQESSRVLVYFGKTAARADAHVAITARATAGEQAITQNGVVWIHYPVGVGQSKITPAIIDRAFGSPATGRNWNTVEKIVRLLTP